MSGGIALLAQSLAIGETLGLCLGGWLSLVLSRRTGRPLAEDVSVGVAIGAWAGTALGLCGWVGLELMNA
jgi:hypothetical protein